MPTSERLPGVHYAEYLAHREIERERRLILIAAEDRKQDPSATNSYFAHRQSTTAIMTFLRQRAYIRDARTDDGQFVLGNYFVHAITASENQDEALLFLSISKDAKEEEAFRVAVLLGTYIMSCK